jgi:hypothetical protein
MAVVTSNEATVTMSTGGGGGATAPVLTAAQSGNAAIQLNWTYSGAVDEWYVYRKMNGGAYALITAPGAANSATRSWLDAGNADADAPTAGNTYTYYISANEIV